MKTILTAITPSGHPHIGNYFGAIKPAIEFNNDEKNKTIVFIADIHSLTSLKDASIRKNNIYSVLASFIALGFDYDKNILFKQSDVSYHGEMMFYLSCSTPYTLLTGSHAFKEKSESLPDVNVGLFTYPVLMASDILLYDTDFVPVGKDQKQHMEITRDIAQKFNNDYGKVFKLPESYVIESQMIVPGIDGRKMSKSYNNYIDPFENEKKLRKTINRIVTDSKTPDEPKDPVKCNVYKLYSLFASEDEKIEMINKYYSGISYSEVKSKLFEKVMDHFSKSRVEYDKIINDYSFMDEVLKIGKDKAQSIASKKIEQVKIKMGL